MKEFKNASYEEIMKSALNLSSNGRAGKAYGNSVWDTRCVGNSVYTFWGEQLSASNAALNMCLYPNADSSNPDYGKINPLWWVEVQ